jgi:iron complex transport system ATP-binding protein
MTAALESLGLSIRNGAKALIDDVSLAIQPGETVALVGPNGAGKSTLLRALSGEIAASAGAVKLKGRDPCEYRPRVLAQHRAMLSQSISVAFPFSVVEVVRMGAGDRRGMAIDRQVDAALEELDLEPFRHRIIGTLSGGEQQRAHLARVLVQLACGEEIHGPGVLLLDEPTAALDLRHQLDVLAVTKRCAERGVTIITVMHDLNLATLFARRVVVLGNGRLLNDGPPSETITDDMLERGFGVASVVGRVPAAGTPFLLPHSARKAGPHQSQHTET